jgi:hypothetical protein
LQDPAGATVYGRVTDEHNEPLPHVEVRLAGTIHTEGHRADGSMSGGSSSSSGATFTAQTGDDGTFQFGQVDANQRYQSAAYAADGALLLEGKRIDDLEPGSSYELNLTVRPLTTVQGVVYGQRSKHPLAGVDITSYCSIPANGSDDSATTGRTKSSDDGSYRLVITGGGGTFEIIPTLSSANALNFMNGQLAQQPGAKTVTLKPGDTLTLDLYIPDPVIRRDRHRRSSCAQRHDIGITSQFRYGTRANHRCEWTHHFIHAPGTNAG